MRTRIEVIALAALLAACIQGDRRAAGTTGTSETDTTVATDGQVADSEPEPDVDDCPGCRIGSACVEEGFVRSDDPCKLCDPLRDRTDWSAVPDETDCDDADPCTAPGQCFQGACVTALLPECGELPPCATDIVCDGSNCLYILEPDTCLVGGTCYAAGEAAPDNICAVCEPLVNTVELSPAGADVTCDDTDDCTDEDHCQGTICAGIPNTCVDELACTTDFCDGGQCRNQPVDACVIDAACQAAGDTRPDASCFVCDPQTDTTDWTITDGDDCDDGKVCTDHDKCSDEGRCLGQARVVDQEPNDTPAQSKLIGEGVVKYPQGTRDGIISAVTDKDLYHWSMPVDTSDGDRRPKIVLGNGGPLPLLACVYVSCGGSVATSGPAVDVACPAGSNAVENPRQGCCTAVAPEASGEVFIVASCSDDEGDVVQGFGYASVAVGANVSVEGLEPCADYQLEFGAAEP